MTKKYCAINKSNNSTCSFKRTGVNKSRPVLSQHSYSSSFCLFRFESPIFKTVWFMIVVAWCCGHAQLLIICCCRHEEEQINQLQKCILVYHSPLSSVIMLTWVCVFLRFRGSYRRSWTSTRWNVWHVLVSASATSNQARSTGSTPTWACPMWGRNTSRTDPRTSGGESHAHVSLSP